MNNKRLLEEMVENDLLSEAIHLLYESKVRLELTLKFNNIDEVDKNYCYKTIDKINELLGEG